MKISIILPVFNSINTLLSCVNSILLQTYRNIEIVVIDAHSKDGSYELIRSFQETVDYIQLFQTPPEGITSAWNLALAHCSGDWILFLGADDELHELSTIEQAVELLANVPKDRFIAYGQVYHLRQRDKFWRMSGEDWITFEKKFRFGGQMLPHQGVFHCKKAFREYGLMDEQFRIAADYDFLLRVLKSSDPYYLRGLVVSKMRFGGQSSDYNSKPLLGEFLLARKKNSYPETFYTILIRMRYVSRGILINLIGLKKTIRFTNAINSFFGRPLYPIE